MNKKNLYNKIMESISKEVKKTLNETENIDIHIKKIYLYPWDNIKDKEFLNINKNQIWEFFDNGYKAANLDSFNKSCLNPNSLKKNANMLKLVYYDDILIAGSVYSGKDKGYKCVGITATTVKKYRKLGVKYVHNIVEEDIMNYEKFYWTICSGPLEKIYEEHGGIKIPSEYLPAFKLFGEYNVVPNGDYKIFVRLNDGNYYEKVIYGFNSKEALNAATSIRDERVLKRIRRIQQMNDSVEYKKYYVNLSEAEKAMSIINVFYEERCNGLEDLSKTLYDILVDSKNTVEQYVASTKISDKDEYNRYVLAIENAQDILDSSTLIKIEKM